ncbi:MAG: response regulator transcription factor [Polyangiales bacterium]
MIRLLVIDDHPIFRGGVVGLIASADDMQVVAEADDGIRALRVANEVVWDVALLDVSLPRLGGIEVLRRLTRAFPERKVLMLSQYPEDQFAVRVMREGASGYIAKTGPPDLLLEAIRRVAVGRELRSAGSSTAVKKVGGAAAMPHETLTPREHQVFMLIASGRSVTEVAAELNVAASTVSNHLLHIKEKLQANTLGAIVAYAHRVGLTG